MENMKENTIAKIIKVYAWLNAVVCIFIGTRMDFPIIGDLVIVLKIMYIAAGIVVSFLLYCIGEVIQLLEDIKSTNVLSQNKIEKVANLISQVGATSNHSIIDEDISSILPEI